MVEHPEMNLELVKEFFEFLQGNDVLENWILKPRPKLTKKQAFSVIYVLQERLGIIPDKFEFCDECHELFDADYGICHVDDKESLKNMKEIGYRVTAKDIGKTFCDSCR